MTPAAPDRCGGGRRTRTACAASPFSPPVLRSRLSASAVRIELAAPEPPLVPPCWPCSACASPSGRLPASFQARPLPGAGRPVGRPALRTDPPHPHRAQVSSGTAPDPSRAGWSFCMASPGNAEGVTSSMGDLSVEVVPSAIEAEVPQHTNGGNVAAAEDDDVWEDFSDSPRHASTLDREWIHRQNQFQKMGYRDGITEGQKDSAQEGFNVGFRQSVNVGYKWGLVRGVASALASLPDSLKEKLVPDVQCRGELQDLHSSVQEISADGALQMFHESISQSNHTSEGSGSHVTSTSDGATESTRMKSLSKELVFLLHECSDIKVSEQLA